MRKTLEIIMVVLLLAGITKAVTPAGGDLWTEDNGYLSSWGYEASGYYQGAFEYVTGLPSQGPGSTPIGPVVGDYFVKSPEMWNTYTYVYMDFPGGPIDLTDANLVVDVWFMAYLYTTSTIDLDIRLYTHPDGNGVTDFRSKFVPVTVGRQWLHFELPVSSFTGIDGSPDMSHVYGIGILGNTGSRVNYCFDGLSIKYPVLEDQGLGLTSLSHGYEVLLRKGLIIDAIAPAYYWGDLNQDNWKSSNFNSIQSLWGITDSGTGGNFGYWTDQIASNVTDYRGAPNLTNIQFYDEQSISDPCLLPGYASYVADIKELYPNSIVYMNNSPAANYYAVSFFDVNVLREFAQAVKPDMLHYTEYPFRWQGVTGAAQNYVGGSPTAFYVHMEMYRKIGLEGVDGTGEKPIPTGMYVQQYRTTEEGSKVWTGSYWIDPMYNTRFPSESEMNLQTFAGWAFGFKKQTSFIYANWGDPNGREVEAVAFSDVAGDNTPTNAFWQIAGMNHQSQNLSGALVRLLSSDVRMKMGKHTGGVTNTLPSGAGVSIKDFTYMPVGYMTGGSIQSHPAGINGGYEGDIVVGFFQSIFKDPTTADDVNETYFMVVNGLSDATADSNACTQTIRLTFDFGTSGITGLQKLNRETGAVEDVVNGWHSSGGTSYYLDTALGGGKGDLFKYKTSAKFIPEKPATILAKSQWADVNGISTNPQGVYSVDVLLDKPVAFTASDISIVDQQNSAVAFTVSGSGSKIMTITFTNVLKYNKYTVTISDSVISSGTGLAIDGNHDGYIGGDAVLVFEHRDASDLNKDNKVNFEDFTSLAIEWLNQY